MQTLIDILKVVLFVTQIAFALSLILLVATFGTWLHDEIKAMQSDRSLELAKNREDLRQLKTEDTTVFTEWVGKHRLAEAIKSESGRHRVIKGAPSYSSSNSYAFNPPRQKLPADDNLFAALISEKEEYAPIF